uniref:Taeniidae antigen n=1 Tax=Marseillevirus LCMAC101 TaxID=2506602 RepID=A0A481YSA2_9VIRU|nr:MAG: taeniidae antigen [Marseillevirus LCMAC101]
MENKIFPSKKGYNVVDVFDFSQLRKAIELEKCKAWNITDKYREWLVKIDSYATILHNDYQAGLIVKFAEYLVETRKFFGNDPLGRKLREKVQEMVDGEYITISMVGEMFPISPIDTSFNAAAHLSQLKTILEMELGLHEPKSTLVDLEPKLIKIDPTPIFVFTVGVVSDRYTKFLDMLGPVQLLKEGCIVTFRDILREDETKADKIHMGIMDSLPHGHDYWYRKLKDDFSEGTSEIITYLESSIFHLSMLGGSVMTDIRRINNRVRDLALKKTREFKTSLVKSDENVPRLPTVDGGPSTTTVDKAVNPIDIDNTYEKYICRDTENPTVRIGTESPKLFLQMKQKLWGLWGKPTKGVEVFNIDSFPDRGSINYIIIDTLDYVPEVHVSSVYYRPGKMIDRLIQLAGRMPGGGTIFYLRKTDIEFSSIPLDKALENNKVVMKRISTLDDIDHFIVKKTQCHICVGKCQKK